MYCSCHCETRKPKKLNEKISKSYFGKKKKSKSKFATYTYNLQSETLYEINGVQTKINSDEHLSVVIKKKIPQMPVPE